MSKQVLGKGLSALIDGGEDDAPKNSGEVKAAETASIKKLHPGTFQPREYFNEGSLLELSESIKKNGILQPIVVRNSKNGYEIIAGERRFRAAKMAGLQEVPIIVKEIDDRQALEIALIENIQRENLTPIEEAEGYKRLQAEFGYTQEQLGGVLGKSRSHITNMLRLLSLPQSVKSLINSGALSMSHARVLVGVEDPQALAEKIINDGLNVREAEKFASGRGHAGGGANGAKITSSGATASKNNVEKDGDLLVLERSLSESLGLKVSIEDDKNGGRVILYFNNLTELDKILQKIG